MHRSRKPCNHRCALSASGTAHPRAVFLPLTKAGVFHATGSCFTIWTDRVVTFTSPSIQLRRENIPFENPCRPDQLKNKLISALRILDLALRSSQIFFTLFLLLNFDGFTKFRFSSSRNRRSFRHRFLSKLRGFQICPTSSTSRHANSDFRHFAEITLLFTLSVGRNCSDPSRADRNDRTRRKIDPLVKGAVSPG